MSSANRASLLASYQKFADEMVDAYETTGVVNSSFAEAINTVLGYINDMFGYLKQEHEAAKTSLSDNDCEDVKECYKKVNNTHLNHLKSIANDSRTNHIRCRKDQYECCKQRVHNPGTICHDYKVVRNSPSFPECFSDRS